MGQGGWLGGQDPIFEPLKIAAEVGQGGAQFMGQISDHVLTQLLYPGEAVGHVVEGPPQVAHLITGGIRARRPIATWRSA